MGECIYNLYYSVQFDMCKKNIFVIRSSPLMKLFTVLVLFQLSVFANAQTYSGPESVEYDYAARRWLIANTSSHQVLSRDSSGTLSIFASGLGSGPYGIEIVGDTLFCCSGGSVKGFLLSTGTSVFNLNIGASFLNGMTHDNSGNLIATDFSSKKIFKINIAAQTFSAIASAMTTTPNGIVFDSLNNRCVYVNWGSNAPICAIDMTTNAITTLTPTTLSSCDGVTRDGSGRYYVSTWGTQSVVRFDSSFAGPPTTVATNLSSPADIYYNVLGDTLAIPNSGNNTVTFVYFPSTVDVHEQDEISKFDLYPNPVTTGSSLNVTMKKGMHVKLELLNNQGQIVVSPVFHDFTLSKICKLETTALKPGLYFLRIVSENRQNVKVLIID